jgi:hypothetical protein
MFVNRQKELDTLHREYKKESASFSVIFGRRRMGKTALISAYINNKPTIYYYATEITRHQHIEQLASQILRFINKPHLKDIKFSDMEQLLIFFSEEIRQRQEKLIFAIDEYQEIVKVIPEFSSILQKVWDIHLKSMKIHMILCGSALSMMHSETLAYDAPLYGRRTSNIHLKSMKFQNIKDFLPFR